MPREIDTIESNQSNNSDENKTTQKHVKIKSQPLVHLKCKSNFQKSITFFKHK